jgi:hypothetical protein
MGIGRAGRMETVKTTIVSRIAGSRQSDHETIADRGRMRRFWLSSLTGAFAVLTCSWAVAATLSGSAEDGEMAQGVSSQNQARIFISGHSLTDNPLPDYLASVAESLGTQLLWNQQNIVGSSIRARTRGDGGESGSWSGYSQGKNRKGHNLNVISELNKPRTIGAGPYDVLIITEQHTLLGALVWNDTVRYLRHYHDRMIQAHPRARTLLYHSWISLNDKSDPRRWIAYEKSAAPLWECIATRINRSLAAEGRSDRIASLPAGSALAVLIERAVQGEGLPGISASNVAQVVDRLIADDVHLTALGSYYMALVSYASIFESSPIGAWKPPDVTYEQARSLQQVAWDFVRDYHTGERPASLEECREYLLKSFNRTYWTYVRDTYWIKESGVARAYAKWIRHMATWHFRFRRKSSENPLYYDAATDSRYWYPPP